MSPWLAWTLMGIPVVVFAVSIAVGLRSKNMGTRDMAKTVLIAIIIMTLMVSFIAGLLGLASPQESKDSKPNVEDAR